MPYRRPAETANWAAAGMPRICPLWADVPLPRSSRQCGPLHVFDERAERVLPRLNRMAYDVVAVVCAQLPTDNGLTPFAYTVAPESPSEHALNLLVSWALTEQRGMYTSPQPPALL